MYTPDIFNCNYEKRNEENLFQCSIYSFIVIQ